MIERKQGTIIFVSSVVGRLAIPYRSAYTASKSALQAFADCLRAELYTHNIKVMVSSPGYVATEVSRNALTGYGTLHGGKYTYFLFTNIKKKTFNQSASFFFRGVSFDSCLLVCGSILLFSISHSTNM